jgi:hypothetical protein
MTSALATISNKLGKLIRLLSSDRDGEVIAAADAIRHALQGAGYVHALAERVEKDGFNETEARKLYDTGYEHTTLPRTATSETDPTTSMAHCCPGIRRRTNICGPKSVHLLIRWPRKPGGASRTRNRGGSRASTTD